MEWSTKCWSEWECSEKVGHGVSIVHGGDGLSSLGGDGVLIVVGDRV